MGNASPAGTASDATDHPARPTQRGSRLGRISVFDIAINLFFGSPEAERLQSSIQRLHRTLQAIETNDFHNTAPPSWLISAKAHLEDATFFSKKRRYDNGWKSYQAAKYAHLSAEKNSAIIYNRAIAARREAAKKLAGWRLRAVNDLLCDRKGKLKGDIAKRLEDVISAVRLIDDEFNTVRHRILLRRRHLVNLFFIIAITLGVFVVLSAKKVLPGDLIHPFFLLAIMAAGALGATLSVALSLLRADLQAKIPTQIVGSFVVWMRPLIGAAAATATALILAISNKYNFLGISKNDYHDAALAIAVFAGFSERFIFGAMERFSGRLRDTEDRDQKE